MLNPLRMVLELCVHGDLLQALRSGKLGPDQRNSKYKGPRFSPYPIQWKVSSTPSLPSFQSSLQVVVDIARGMSFLHGLDPPVAHRDLRSPNVCSFGVLLNITFLQVLIWSFNPRAISCAKVCDFGLSSCVTEGFREGSLQCSV